ncbi:MAG: hypothetical protein WBW62_12965 [Solirubrobacterales bacterium]
MRLLLRNYVGISALFFCLLAAQAALSSPALGKSGAPDPDFGRGGTFSSPAKIGGVVGVDYLSNNRLVSALSRYGEAHSAFVGPSAAATDLAVAPDSSYFLTGWHGRPNLAMGYVISHFTSDGNPIKRFGSGGTAVGKAVGKVGKDIALTAVDVQKDGKAVASGGHGIGFGTRPAGIVMRFRNNGRPDHSFSGDGIARFPVSGRNGSSTALMDIEALPNGKILASGYSKGRVIAVRLKKNGKRDRSFGGNGVVTLPRTASQSCEVNGWCLEGALTVAANGDPIILSNRPHSKSKGKACECVDIIRLTNKGKRRKGFGNHGVATMGRTLQHGTEIIARRNGQIIAAGAVGGHMGAVQLKQNGKLDRSFGTNGRVSVGCPWRAESAHLAPNGKLTLAGAGDKRLHFARFLP